MIIMSFERLLDAVLEEYRQERRSVYIWLGTNGPRYNGVISSHRDNHTESPAFVYHGEKRAEILSLPTLLP